MKCIMMILGGAADRPSAQLDGRTPLAVARTPTLAALAESGKVGRVRTAPSGLEPSLAATLQTLLGYLPDQIVTGGGPFEAIGLGAAIGAGEIAYRLSLVTTLDGVVVDPTAGGIGTAEAGELFKDLREGLSGFNVELTLGAGHRHVMIARDRADVAVTHAPGAVVGRAMEEYLPQGAEGEFLRGIVDRAHAILSQHEVNRVRVDLEENPADGLWPFGGGRLTTLPSLPERLGVSTALFSDEPIVTGLAVQSAISVMEGDAARPTPDGILNALRSNDLTIAYVSPAAEVSGGADPGPKVRALEGIDRDLLTPLVAGIPDLDEPCRLLVVVDRVVPMAGRPEAGAVPFLLAGEGVSSVRQFPFDESGAAASDLSVDEGHLLLDYLLGRPARP